MGNTKGTKQIGNRTRREEKSWGNAINNTEEELEEKMNQR